MSSPHRSRLQALPPPPPPWWVDMQSEIAARMDAHRQDKLRRARLRLLASRALAVTFGLWGFGWLAVLLLWVGLGVILVAGSIATGLVAACLVVAAALPREDTGTVTTGRARRRPRGAA